MLFNSLTFVIFFAVVVTAYWSMRSWNARKNLLVAASYIFYGAWNPPFAALLFSTTAMDYWLGARIAAARGSRSRKLWLVGSVAMNLSMLGFFKYGNFLLENFQWLLARMGVIYQPPHLDILLPVGISFYTFHSLSYTLDIYRGVLQPTKSLRDFILAVSFFPQLVAGPIVRAGDFLPQLLRPPRLKNGQFLWGLALMTSGTLSEDCSGRYPSLRLRRSRLWLSRTTGCARLVGRRTRVCRANLFRFRRVFSLRDRRCLNPGFPSQGQLSFPLCRDRLFGFLAAVAHFAFHFSSRLPLHSAWWQSGQTVPCGA